MTNSTVQITKYNILCKGKKIHSALTEEEYLEVIGDLALEYYQTGSPLPEDITTEIIGELSNGTI
jgi:hypothetical protein